MAMNKVTNGCHPGPSKRSGTKSSPGEIQQFAVNFTITARQYEGERFYRQISDILLARVRKVGIQGAGVANEPVIEKTYHPCGAIDAAAMVSEIVYILFNRHLGFDFKFLRFDEIPFA